MSWKRMAGQRRTARNWGRGACLLLVLVGGLALTGTPGLAQQDTTGTSAKTPPPKKFRMPRVLPEQFTAFAGDSTRAWARATLPKVRDRSALFAAVRDAVKANQRFSDEVAKIYPRNQLEWLVITDRAADSLAVRLGPILAAYDKAYPDEVLTAGRVAFEQQIAQIVGPPSRMLGFHVTLLADHSFKAAETLLGSGGVTDVAGVQDGVLRNLQDWVHQYDQVHFDALSRHESQMTEEDWILARLEDTCGNHGDNLWELKDMYVARVGVDSTKTPPEDQYAHEYTIASRKCPEDSRVIYLDMTMFQEAEKELYKRSVARDLELQEEAKKKPQ